MAISVMSNKFMIDQRIRAADDVIAQMPCPNFGRPFMRKLAILLAALLVPATALAVDPEHVVIKEDVAGSSIPVEYRYVETRDGLYAPIALRKPVGDGPFPVVVLASGNGGGGMAWIRDAVASRGHIMEILVESGYAAVWMRYRAEVDLGYNTGGPLVEDVRQGRQLLSRSPLEYEDAIDIIDYLKALPFIDADRVGYIGLSHGGEMALKIAAEYHGLAAAVANEPAAHEFLALSPDDSAGINAATGLRDLETMRMDEVAKVRARVDMEIAKARIATIETPFLVMGRDQDHLQGIFMLTRDLLQEAGKDVEWVSWRHPEHGYIYPYKGADGALRLDEVQRRAIAGVIDFFDRHLGKT